MRNTLGLLLAVSAAVFFPIACGADNEGSDFNDGTRTGDQNTSGGTSGFDPNGRTDGGGGGGSAQDVDVASMRIEPADAVISVLGGQKATKPYKVFAKLKGSTT